MNNISFEEKPQGDLGCTYKRSIRRGMTQVSDHTEGDKKLPQRWKETENK